MAHKKQWSLYGLASLFLCCSLSCRQQGNTVLSDHNTAVPVLLNDSALLYIDRSPMDMSYFPEEYPKEKMVNPGIDNLVARVIYSRPQKKGRMIFADSTVKENFIQHYGEDWRMGANEATEIEFFKDVTIETKKIPRGRYIIYCIPYPEKWKVVFNSNLFSWGLHMDKTKDLAEIELPVTRNNTAAEFFTLFFQKAAYGCNLVIMWGDIRVIMPIRFS